MRLPTQPDARRSPNADQPAARLAFQGAQVMHGDAAGQPLQRHLQGRQQRGGVWLKNPPLREPLLAPLVVSIAVVNLQMVVEVVGILELRQMAGQDDGAEKDLNSMVRHG